MVQKDAQGHTKEVSISKGVYGRRHVSATGVYGRKQWNTACWGTTDSRG